MTKTRLGWALALVVGTVALHAPQASHPFLWDDNVQIAENPAVTRGVSLGAWFLDRTTTSSRADYNTRIYRPLRNLAFRGIVVLAGVRPVAFGVANLACYALSVLLVLALARRLGASFEAAVAAAALWAAAPVHVEPVAYASALGDQLSATLELAAILVGMTAIEEESKVRANLRFVTLGAISVLLAAGAMLAKEMAVTECALLALVAARFDGSAPRSRRMFALVGAHGVITIAYLALRTSVLSRVGQDDVTFAGVARGFGEAPVLLWSYARIALAPLGHSAAYQVSPPSLALSVVAAVAAGAVLAAAWRLRGPGAWPLPGPWPLQGLAWFCVALIPVLHLVPLWADLADRFVLVPSVGLALAAAALLSLLPEGARRSARLVTAAVLMLYAGGTLVEARRWRSDTTLWAHAVDEQPEVAMAHANLGVALLVDNRPAEALVELDRARALGRGGAALALRRGMALDAVGRPAEAEVAVLEALREDPADGPAHALLGDLLRRQDRLDAAQVELDAARRLAPDHPSTTLLAANLALSRGQPAAAAALFGDLARRSPRPSRYRYLQARALLAAHDPVAADAAARACLAADPEQPQCVCLRARALVDAALPDGSDVALPRDSDVALPRDSDVALPRGSDAALLNRAIAALPDGEDKAACALARAHLIRP